MARNNFGVIINCITNPTINEMSKLTFSYSICTVFVILPKTLSLLG